MTQKLVDKPFWATRKFQGAVLFALIWIGYDVAAAFLGSPLSDGAREIGSLGLVTTWTAAIGLTGIVDAVASRLPKTHHPPPPQNTVEAGIYHPFVEGRDVR